jgi:hypothetical protein
MQPLSQPNIEAMLRLWSGASKSSTSPLYAVEYPKSVIVTDGSFLLEWPKELVDLDSRLFGKLLDNAGGVIDAGEWRTFDHWTQRLTYNNRYFPATMAEPNEYKPMAGFNTAVYHCRNRYCYYDLNYLSIVEGFLNDRPREDIAKPKKWDLSKLSYQCYSPSKELMFLCPFEGPNVVGAIANILPEWQEEPTKDDVAVPRKVSVRRSS